MKAVAQNGVDEEDHLLKNLVHFYPFQNSN